MQRTLTRGERAAPRLPHVYRSPRFLSSSNKQHEATECQHQPKRHHIEEDHDTEPGKSISAVPMIAGNELDPHADNDRQHQPYPRGAGVPTCVETAGAGEASPTTVIVYSSHMHYPG